MTGTAMQAHFRSMAAYSAWANARLLADAAALPEGAFERPVGVYFGSLKGTLDHLLQADRAWLHLLQGGSLRDLALPPLPADFAGHRAAREAQDATFTAWVQSLDDGWFEVPFEFVSGMQSWKGLTWRGTHGSTLTHVLNHQTHHRGQAHAALTLLGVKEPNALDLLVKGMLGQ
jgi:uncharacterized damage-inducible protein DinB